METAVRKATRLEYRPPKEKHLLTLKSLTIQNPACIDSILIALEKRLKERSWIITYKVLIIVHYLMREGNSNAVADAVMKRPSVLDASNIKNKASAPANVQNIYLYRAYLDERIIAYRHLKRDYAAKKESRLRHLKVSEGLLKETTFLQRQMESVLKCKFHLTERDSLSITCMAYRMTIEDLFLLFQSVNEAVINILEHYFEMSKKDAKEALDIYKNFAQQTEYTIEYLNDARKLQNDLQMSIPTIKHAPISLASALEDYLNESDNIQAQKQTSSSQQEPQTIGILPQNTNNDIYTSQHISVTTNFPQQTAQNPFLEIMNHPQPVMNPPFATVSHSMSSQMADNNPFRSLRASSYNANTITSNPTMNSKLEIRPFSQQLTGNTNSMNPFATIPVTPPLTPHQPINSFGSFQVPQHTNNNYPPQNRNPFSQYSSPPSAF